MRSWIALLLSAVLTLPLSACGGSAPSAAPSNEEFSVGDTILADGAEFSLCRLDFGKGLSRTPNEGFLLPVENTSESSTYLANDGSVFVSFTYGIKNTSETEFDLIDYGWTIDLVYNEDTFSSKPLGSYDCWADGRWSSLQDNRYLAPLSSREYRGFLEVPKEVLDNTDTPLHININLYLPTEDKNNSDRHINGTYLTKVVYTYRVR